jgi:hypothetical protein
MFYEGVPKRLGIHPWRTMPANAEPKQEESITGQPAVPDLEIEADELEQEDTGEIAGGGGMGEPMVL